MPSSHWSAGYFIGNLPRSMDLLRKHSGGGTYALFHTRYDRSLAAPSSGKEFFFHQSEDRSDPGGLSCRSEFDRCDAHGAWSDSGTRNRSFFRHGRCYLRYGWHRTHPSGSKLGSLVTSDPAQHI